MCGFLPFRNLGMEKNTQGLLIEDRHIISKIHMVRGQKVMIDRDLAELYGVETKRLKEQVRRNISRFPDDFMFEMTSEEFRNWRSQIATSNSDKMGLRHPPFCFTEQGVAMLSSVLNSELAIQMNIRIIRVYTLIRQLLLENTDLWRKVDGLEKRMFEKNNQIDEIYYILQNLTDKGIAERAQIGFRMSKKN